MQIVSGFKAVRCQTLASDPKSRLTLRGECQTPSPLPQPGAQTKTPASVKEAGVNATAYGHVG